MQRSGGGAPGDHGGGYTTPRAYDEAAKARRGVHLVGILKQTRPTYSDAHESVPRGARARRKRRCTWRSTSPSFGASTLTDRCHRIEGTRGQNPARSRAPATVIPSVVSGWRPRDPGLRAKARRTSPWYGREPATRAVEPGGRGEAVWRAIVDPDPIDLCAKSAGTGRSCPRRVRGPRDAGTGRGFCAAAVLARVFAMIGSACRDPPLTRQMIGCSSTTTDRPARNAAPRPHLTPRDRRSPLRRSRGRQRERPDHPRRNAALSRRATSLWGIA